MLRYSIVYPFVHHFTLCGFRGSCFNNEKGTLIHKTLGWVYMVLMMFTAFVSLLLPVKVGPQFFSHFGWIHSLSVLTLTTVPTAIIAVRKGEIRKHKIKMISLYFGAILIVGGFTLAPGR